MIFLYVMLYRNDITGNLVTRVIIISIFYSGNLFFCGLFSLSNILLQTGSLPIKTGHYLINYARYLFVSGRIKVKTMKISDNKKRVDITCLVAHT